MRVLWITNILFPDICNKLGIQPPVTGGWMQSLISAIKEYSPNVQFGIAALYGTGKELIEREINGITYFCLPFNPYNTKYNSKEEIVWKDVHNRFKPDLIHIHGTEFPHGLAYIKANGGENVIASIQGLRKGIAPFALAGIPIPVLKNMLAYTIG